MLLIFWCKQHFKRTFSEKYIFLIKIWYFVYKTGVNQPFLSLPEIYHTTIINKTQKISSQYLLQEIPSLFNEITYKIAITVSEIT